VKRHAGFLLFPLLAILLAAGASAQKSYTLDEDPIRIGKKAIETGRLTVAKQALREAVNNEYHLDEAMFLLAEVAVLEGRYGDAEPLYRQALGYRSGQNGRFPEAHAGLGLLLLRFDRDAEASLEFDQALEQEPGLWEAEYGKARLLLAQKDWEGAKKLLEKGAGRKGLGEGEDKYHYGMALYFLGTNQIREAEREALTALTMNASDADYGTLVGRIYQERNVPTLAIDAYEKALSTPGISRTAPMMHTLGLLYQDVGRYNDARDSYLEAVAIDSTYSPALKDLGDLFFRAKQYDRAARVYLRYVLVEKGDVDVLLNLAQACTNSGRYGQAVEAAKTALEIDNSRTDVKFALARAGLHTRDPGARAAAARMYAALPDSLPWTAEDHVLLATYYIQTKDHPRAQRSLDRALALDSENAEAYFQQGVLDLSTGRPAAAVTNLETATRLDPENPLPYLNLGIARIQLQEVREAIAPLRRALVLRDDILVGRMLLAQALAASDSIGSAQVEYERILEEDPGNAKALRGLGFCRIRLEEYEEAVESYRLAAQAEPDNAEGWAGLGNAYLGLKDWDAAETAFQKARTLDPDNPTMLKGFELLGELRNRGGGGP
jgi:tetratricopeptide (TPR) repeat protein